MNQDSMYDNVIQGDVTNLPSSPPECALGGDHSPTHSGDNPPSKRNLLGEGESTQSLATSYSAEITQSTAEYAERPPSTIEGGNPLQKNNPKKPIRAGLDWLTATIGWADHEDPQKLAEGIIRGLGDKGDIQQTDPKLRNYTRCLQGHYINVSWHHQHPRMKLCTSLTGSVLAEMSEHGIDPQMVAWRLHQIGASFTRVDVAFDYYGDASIHALYEALKKDQDPNTTRYLLPYHVHDCLEGTDTYTGLDIGSRKSDRYIVAYNKAVELDITSTDLWHRIELRNRKAKAQMLIESGCENAIDRDTGEIKPRIVAAGRDVIRKRSNPDCDWWREALEGDCVEALEVGKKQTNTDKWLLGVVLHTLERRLRDSPIAEDIFDAYKKVLDESEDKLGINAKPITK